LYLNLLVVYILNLSGIWVEQRPTGQDANNYWGPVAISPNGSRMLAAIQADTGRFYSYYNGVWTEERPIGNVNVGYYSCDVTDAGDMIVCMTGSRRLYIKSSGGSWVETQPDGAVNKGWRSVNISADGTKFLAVAYNDYAYKYESGTWSKIYPQPQYPVSTLTHMICDCDANVDKIILCRSNYAVWCNATMNETYSYYNWPTLAGGSSTYSSCGAISADNTLLVGVTNYGRMYIHDRDTLPEQTAEGFYKEFTYTHAAGTRTNFKVRLRVYNKASNNTVLHCEGRANDDFSDIYFTNASGTILRHCLVNDDAYCNGLTNGYCRYVWIELDEVGTSPTTFRMYYGDSTHTDTSTDPVVFFDQYDDFEGVE